MIRCEYFDSNAEDANLISKSVGQIVLQPNHSLSWRALKYFLAFMMILSFGIAIAFLFFGYWLVLPFTGLEMGVLSYCLWLCLRRGSLQEGHHLQCGRGSTGNRYRRSRSNGNLGALFYPDSRHSSHTSVVSKDRRAGASRR